MVSRCDVCVCDAIPSLMHRFDRETWLHFWTGRGSLLVRGGGEEKSPVGTGQDWDCQQRQKCDTS